MAERLASQTLQKFAELEELAQEIMEDKQQVQIFQSETITYEDETNFFLRHSGDFGCER